MDDIAPQKSAPNEWVEVLAESEAELEAGLSVPMEDVLRMIRESIDRMEAKAARRREAV